MAELSVAPNAAPSKAPSPSKTPNQSRQNTKAGNATITIPLKPDPKFKPEDAAKYNQCGFDLEKANKITLEAPKKNKDGSFIMTIEQPAESQDSGGIVDKMTEYCAFDGKQYVGGQIDSHTTYGTTKLTYWTCDQKDECDPTDRSRYQIGDTNLKPYFENGKLIRKTQAEIQDKIPDKVGDETK